MKNIFLIFLVFISIIASGQTSTQNYIKTLVYKQPTATSNPNMADISVTYFDGLGRPIQQILGKQSNEAKDLITHIEYDGFGRQSKEYLPYAATTDNLDFDVSAQANTVAFYNTSIFENTLNPYSEKFFDTSPASRVMKQGYPGTPWLGSATSDNDHTAKFAYLSNTSNDVVKKLSATAAWNAVTEIYDNTFVSNGNYAAGTLFKTITQDENKASEIYIGTDINRKLNTQEQYKNSEGKVLLQRTFTLVNGSFATLDTYYVYDQFGNLAYVLPPKANGSISQEDKLCYHYKYDLRNRLVEKRLPGKTWEFVVYDALDRVVATGPTADPWATSSTTTGWLITQYDNFNRVAYVGWYGASGFNSSLRKNLQGASFVSVAKTTTSQLIDGISIYYTNTLPTVPVNVNATFKLLTISYYDNYTFNGAPSSSTLSTPIETQTVSTNIKGSITGNWTRALIAPTNTTGETSYILYDFKGRPISTRVSNHLGGYTQIDRKIDFDETLLHITNKHKRSSNSTDQEIITSEDFTYNPQDRLLSQTHTITGMTPQLMSDNTYNSIGRLTKKKVGNTSASPLQTVDYRYNIRGWLTGINVPVSQPALPSPGGPITTTSNDLFIFYINYNETISQNINGKVEPLYNGNIAETSWRTGSDDILRRYGYTYDNANRLTDAWYQIPSATVPVRNSYDEHLKYDNNGNITSLQRNGNLDSDVTVTEIDNLAYTYDGNRLTKVTDNSLNTASFRDVEVAGVPDYTYDVYGNMLTDKNKGINTAITYNHLNLPVTININDGNYIGTISYLYNSSGVKLKKTVINNAVSPAITTVTDYLGGYQYINNTLDFFPTSEGYVKNTFGGGVNNYSYVFQYKDHLGNNRISYLKDSDGILKILEEDHYYPFGLKHEGYSADQQMIRRVLDVLTVVPVINPADVTYKYIFNGKELQNELGLKLIAMDYRQYDSTLGRFNSLDVLSEKAYSITPYRFALNNPNLWMDPTGLFETRKEARKYRREHGIKGSISKQSDGTYAISDKKNGIIYSKGDDSNFGSADKFANDGVVESLLIEASTKTDPGFWSVSNGKNINDFAGLGLAPVELIPGAYRLTTTVRGFSPHYYRNTGWGNQYTRIHKFSKLGKNLGYGGFFAGAVLDGFGVYNYYDPNVGPESPNSVHPAKAGLNTGMALYGLYINPIPALLYSSVDTLYPGGWEGALDMQSKLNQENRAVVPDFDLIPAIKY